MGGGVGVEGGWVGGANLCCFNAAIFHGLSIFIQLRSCFVTR